VEGTAFRIGEDLLLTNQHVLVPFGEMATQVTAEFGFETDAGGNGLPSRTLACKPAEAVVDAAGDWGAIRVAEPLDPTWPIVALADAADPVAGEPAYILEHPLGGRKRLAFVRNTVTDFDDQVVHYLTDTQSGSSGSPVFNAAGKLIALHHAGGEPQDVAGKTPMKKNEGIRIPRVLQALVAAGLLKG
jgi:V8-like Glu-specific endopeptidase